MNYAKAKNISKSAIPVIDLADLRYGKPESYHRLAKQFLDAAETVGFFYVANHGISADLINNVFNISRDFFQHSIEDKNQVKISNKHRGFLSIGEAKMYGSETIDLKESFLWGREFADDQFKELEENPLIGRNQWPEFIPQMPLIFNQYFEECVLLGRHILRVFAAALEIEPEYFTKHFDYTITRASTIYYPPQPGNMGEKQFGVAPHTDYGCLTLLHQDHTGGLQVMGKEGEWVTAHPIENTFVVNIGDLLERWTNNRFVSTPHRVVNSSGTIRQSIAVFVDPDFDTEIVPVVSYGEEQKHEITTCGKYILGRFDQSFRYRK